MKIGSIVICIDDSNWHPDAHVKMSSLPKRNKIYTIRKILHEKFNYENLPGVALEGIFGEWGYGSIVDNKSVYIECHFKIKRFEELLPPLSKKNLIANKVECDLMILSEP